jgi:hypothetical protein
MKMQKQLIPVELVTAGFIHGGLHYTVSPKLNVLLEFYTYTVHKRKHAKDDGNTQSSPSKDEFKTKTKGKNAAFLDTTWQPARPVHKNNIR